jgi:4'-phosphopantetheinyl transferase
MESETLANQSHLGEYCVHVWAIPTPSPDEVAARFQRLLAFDERERAARFRSSHLQRSFVISRGALRLLLGAYLDAAPSDIQFQYGSHGKPALAPPARISFNVSHSGDLALFAFMIDSQVGIDVEQVRPLSDIHEIASRFFCKQEAGELLSLPVDQQERAFFSCWTRKEAYIKAIGDGLSAPLNNFRVTLRPGEPATVVHVAKELTAVKAWTMHDISLGSKYAAALAYRGEPRFVRMRSIAHAAELLDFESFDNRS